jgi:hypothetical protein
MPNTIGSLRLDTNMRTACSKTVESRPTHKPTKAPAPANPPSDDRSALGINSRHQIAPATNPVNAPHHWPISPTIEMCDTVRAPSTIP